MKSMKKANLVIAKRKGRVRWNHLDLLFIRVLHDQWISRYAIGTVDLLAKMKREIEKR
jgi:hypothetical protein